MFVADNAIASTTIIRALTEGCGSGGGEKVEYSSAILVIRIGSVANGRRQRVGAKCLDFSDRSGVAFRQGVHFCPGFFCPLRRLYSEGYLIPCSLASAIITFSSVSTQVSSSSRLAI